MEAMLPDDAWVLGIDEHTVLTVDLDARTVAVSGRGGLTVRRRGVSQVFAAGQRLGLDALLAAARGDATRARASGARARRGGRGRADRGERPGAAVATPRRGGAARASIRVGHCRPQGLRGRRGHPDPRPRDRRVVGGHAADRTSPIELGPSSTRWFSGRAKPPRAASATRASSRLRWSRTSSPFEASCGPRAPSSSPTGCATA